MKKLLSIAVASLLIVCSAVSCGNESTENSSEEVSEIVTEAETEAETEEETEAETEEAENDADVPEMDVDLTAGGEKKDPPVIVAEEKSEADFVGMWECEKMYTGGMELSGDFYGMPMSVVMQLTINEDGTGTIGTGIETPDDTAGAEPFTWTYADNKLTVTDSAGTEEECVIADGYLIVAFYDEEEYIYLKKVDEFTSMTQDELYAAMGLDPSMFAESEETESADGESEDSAPAAEEAAE